MERSAQDRSPLGARGVAGRQAQHGAPTPVHQIRALPGTELGSQGHLLGLLDSLCTPMALVLSLWGSCLFFEGTLLGPYVLLSLLVFWLAYPSRGHLASPGPWTVVYNVAFEWAWMGPLVLALLWSTGLLSEFDRKAIKWWLMLAPAATLAFAFALRVAAPALLTLQGPKRRVLIAGLNAQGLALARRLQASRYAHTQLLGFVDSRVGDRIDAVTGADGGEEHHLLGALDDLARIVRQQHVNVVYLSLPMASQPRILELLDQMKDTTASVYFVPDMFVTDLIQGRAGSVAGLPVIAVCESPLVGTSALSKRLFDIAFSSLVLLLLSPLLLAIAVAVKRSSPGPVIFRQRRYGQEGEEIAVWKFRSMTVTEDGPQVTQATRGDQRITPLGAFLRRTSLDELPQFFNVLQGRMSIVGPRPHAVAHNEMYRKLIKGYMVRHKVKPGITGWAQVNGFRGETETLDKMQGRIAYDLEYLRNWSLRLDLYIVFKTVKLVLYDRQAY